METSTMIWIAAIIIVGIVGAYIISYIREKKSIKESEPEKASPGGPLQLQAYERLTILTERISLKGLVARLPAGGLTAKQYQGLLQESIRTEYDYNLSQQLYVSAQAWQAISNLKEQNIFIINQLSSTLPPEATGIDLAKRILELLEADPQASLHNIVLEALKYDAKKLMG
jgi:hypothetical protein